MATTTFPDATTTGVPAGTKLTAYTGPMTITQPGTVIDGKIINGTLRVMADNVVIKNSQINFSGWWGVDAEGAKNITIQDSDIVGPGYSGSGNAAILGSGNFLRNDISKTSNGITLQGGASIVQGNYIHDLEAGGADPHYDGIEVFGGQKNVLIDNNTIISRDTSNILISDLYGAVSNVTVSNNFLGGNPGYNIYVTGERSGTTGVSITNNTIAKGGYGYYYLYETNPSFSGNSEMPSGTKPPVNNTGGGEVGGGTGGGTGGETGGGIGGGDGGTGGTVTEYIGTAGNDVLPADGKPNGGNEIYRGLGGNDILRGGAGADVLDGGDGSDTASYAGSNAGVTVNLKTGAASGGHATGDKLISIENLLGSSHADKLYGDDGANILDGGAGADIMSGGKGNDIYIVDNVRDVVIEAPNGGTDSVRSSVTFTLSSNVENLTLTGSANINAYGNGGANVLQGNSGHNVLNGGGGADTMIGGKGNDIYYVDHIGDKVVEDAGGGTDMVMSSISFTLGANVENLTLTGSANLSGTGNALANVLRGNAGNNVLSGGAGNDTLSGGAGNDTLKGGIGNDILTGGAGKDTFVFDTALNAKTNVDKITDFSVIDDVIHLDHAVFAALKTGALSSANFVKNTTGLAADANDHIVYETDTGKLFYDSNGSAPGGSVHFATLTPNLALTAADFVVI